MQGEPHSKILSRDVNGQIRDGFSKPDFELEPELEPEPEPDYQTQTRTRTQTRIWRILKIYIQIRTRPKI